MSEDSGWPILSFFHKAVSIFVFFGTLIGLFTAWQLIQTRPHVMIYSVMPMHKIDIDTVRKVYTEQDVPIIVEQAVTIYNEQLPIPRGLFPRSAICPQDPVQWNLFMTSERPGWCGEEWIESIPEEWLVEPVSKQCKAFYELIQSRRSLVSVVRTKFEFGEPRAACEVSLAVALSGELDEQELSFAADALVRGEYVNVSVWLTNDGKVVAQEVKVTEPEGFECVPWEAYQTIQCGPFDMEIDEDKIVQFRAEQGRFIQKSDDELARMFKVEWKETEAIDTPRLLLLLKIAGAFTACVAFLDLGYKLRKHRREMWGKVLLMVVLTILLILLFTVIRLVRLVAI